MASPFFSGRIPQELNNRINQHCNETGESKTQVLLNALSKYLNFPIKPPVTTDISTEKFNQLEQRVTKLEKKLKITSVSSSDNSIVTVDNISDKIDDNNTNLVKQPDNTLIVDNSDNNNKQNLEAVRENQTQLSILDSKQQTEVDQDDYKPWIIKTNEASNLPGLEEKDKRNAPQKLRSARFNGKTEIQIREYLLRYYGKEEGAKPKGSLLWEVITKDNSR